MKSVELSGQSVSLEPLAEYHREPLRVLARDPNLSKYAPYTMSDDQGFDRWFSHALKGFELGDMVPFVVKDLSNGSLVGSTRFYDIDMDHLTCAIGYTWYIKSVQGASINPECKLLLLNHGFEMLKMNRVVFHVDALNLRSRAAVKKIGAIEEGVMRSHLIVQNNRIRDSVLYSIVKDEWPSVKKRLLSRLVVEPPLLP